MFKSNSYNRIDGWFTPSRFLFITALCLFTAFPEVITTVATFVFRDYGIFSYPNAYYFRQSFWKGEVPLWNPLSNCGLPFLAQWNTQVLYPFSFFYLTFPLDWSLNLFNLLHQLFGGVGAYILLFMLSKSRLGAAVGATIYAFNGLTMNCIMWQSTIAALGWAPWFISAVYLSVKKSKPVWRAVVAGSMQILAGSPEITMATAVVTVALILPVIFDNRNYCSKVGENVTVCRKSLSNFALLKVKIVKLILIATGIGVLTSVQTIPFFELVAESDRSGSYIGSIWNMPVYGWANLIVPLFHCYHSALGVFLQYDQWWTSSYYCSLIGILFFIFVILKTNKEYFFLLAIVFLLGIALAMGSEGLLYDPLIKIFPIIKMMRYPVKFTLLCMMALPFFAAEAIKILMEKNRTEKNDNPESFTKKIRDFKYLLTIFVMLIAISILILIDNALYPLERDNVQTIIVNTIERWGLTFGIIICIYALLKNHQPLWFYQFAIPIFILVDILTHNPIQNPTTQPWVFEPNLVRKEWEKDESLKPLPENGISRVLLRPQDDYLFGHGYFSEITVDYLASRLFLFCNCNILDNFPKTDGFFPVYLKRYYKFYQLIKFQNIKSYEKLLDLMCVSHINEEGKFFHFIKRPKTHPFIVPGREPIFENQTNILHRIVSDNYDLEKQVIISDEFKNYLSAKPTENWKILNYIFAPHKISFDISTDKNTLVFISQAYDRQWSSYVDGRKTAVYPANYAFQCIEVPEGKHTVTLVYFDTGFIFGLVLSVFAFVYLFLRIIRNHCITY